jgi:hypothetical protein
MMIAGMMVNGFEDAGSEHKANYANEIEARGEENGSDCPRMAM